MDVDGERGEDLLVIFGFFLGWFFSVVSRVNFGGLKEVELTREKRRDQRPIFSPVLPRTNDLRVDCSVGQRVMMEWYTGEPWTDDVGKSTVVITYEDHVILFRAGSSGLGHNAGDDIY